MLAQRLRLPPLQRRPHAIPSVAVASPGGPPTATSLLCRSHASCSRSVVTVRGDPTGEQMRFQSHIDRQPRRVNAPRFATCDSTRPVTVIGDSTRERVQFEPQLDQRFRLPPLRRLMHASAVELLASRSCLPAAMSSPWRSHESCSSRPVTASGIRTNRKA